MPGRWSSSLFDCFNVKDAGLMCCFNHCFCGICIRTEALKKAGVKNALNYAITSTAGMILASSDNSTVASIGNTAQSVSFVKGRQQLLKIYNIEEPIWKSICASFCCTLCSQIQEVNTVMENENLIYGFATLKSEPNVKSAPKSQNINRHTHKSRANLGIVS
jgi:Cys-rich protein (TIGR01571 family)